MNQRTFEELISDSSLLNKDNLSDLEQLLKEYPFCQTFHLLYTKELHKLKHIRYHQQLKLAAAIVGDRTRLKHFIEGSEVIKKVSADKLADLPVKIVESIPEEEEVISVVPEFSEPGVQVEVSDIFLKDTCDIDTEPVQQDVEDYEPVPENNSEPMPGVIWDAEYESVLLSTLDVEVSREEKKKAIIALINKKFSERNRELEKANTKELLSEESKVIMPPVVKFEININGIDEIIEDESESDNEILKDSSETKDFILQPWIDTGSKTNGGDQTVNTGKESKKELQPASDKKEKTESKVLIERFLRDEPRISRPRKEFFNPVNLAARSVEENEDFYTETYASICLKQGNALKTIKIYDKLSLKFPEKSSYFAGLIEEIKKEQNI